MTNERYNQLDSKMTKALVALKATLGRPPTVQEARESDDQILAAEGVSAHEMYCACMKRTDLGT